MLELLDPERLLLAKMKLQLILRGVIAPSLKSLTITGELSFKDCETIGDCIRTVNALKELYLKRVLDKAGLEVIAKALLSNKQSLERLKLITECLFTDAAAENLAKFIKKTSPNLHNLEIREFCSASCHGLKVMVENMHHSFKLQYCQLGVSIYDGNDIKDLDQVLRIYPDWRHYTDLCFRQVVIASDLLLPAQILHEYNPPCKGLLSVMISSGSDLTYFDKALEIYPKFGKHIKCCSVLNSYFIDVHDLLQLAQVMDSNFQVF